MKEVKDYKGKDYELPKITTSFPDIPNDKRMRAPFYFLIPGSPWNKAIPIQFYDSDIAKHHEVAKMLKA